MQPSRLHLVSAPWPHLYKYTAIFSILTRSLAGAGVPPNPNALPLSLEVPGSANPLNYTTDLDISNFVFNPTCSKTDSPSTNPPGDGFGMECSGTRVTGCSCVKQALLEVVDGQGLGLASTVYSVSFRPTATVYNELLLIGRL